MQKFIEERPEELNSKFINLNKLFSFSWAKIFGVIGARGYGKTYFIKRMLAKDFIFKNKKFVVLRDTIDACEKIAENNGQQFFGDVFTIEKNLQKHSYSIEKDTIKIDDKNAGKIIALSAYYKYKGNYYDAENILFDEFIAEKIQSYRGNRARQFINTIETIARDRDIKVCLTANALELGNDILEALDIHITNGKFGYYINYEKKVVIYYAPDSRQFLERKKNSLSGIIANNTIFSKSINENKFEEDSCIIFEKREPCSLFGIYYNLENECCRLYKALDDDIYYCCKDINSNSYNYMRYVFNINQVSKNKILANEKVLKFLKNLIQTNKILFESQYIFNVFCSILNKTIKK